ncbi:MAG TPA: DUF3450 domain-containing protein [Gammaproteobacteria bacterium]|nr:DUF3450 domain-containing protein [Gammaproteobacteria bacterium]
MNIKSWYRSGGVALAFAAILVSGAAAAQDSGNEYAKVMAQVDQYSQYNVHLEQLLQSQQRDIQSLTRQIAGLQNTADKVQSLVQKMFAELEKFVASDLPFMQKERNERIAALREQMQKEGEPAEKFRRLLEAYMIEVEYGRTMQNYPGQLNGRDVQFLHLGRVSLMYRTTDGDETGYWDRNTKSWVVDSDYARAIEEAIRMAQETLAPDLLVLPVPAPESRS